MQKIHRTATLLIPVLIVFAVLYVVFTAGSTLEFAFLDQERWYQSDWVDPDAPVPDWQRAIYLFMWLMPVFFGLLAVCCAFWMVLLIRKGILFDARISRLLRWVGIGTSASGFADFIAELFTPQVLSWTNPTGPVAFEWYFDSEPAGLIVCGGGFYLIGWILAEARRLAYENDGFI